MKVYINGNVIHFLLAQEFEDVVCDRSARRVMVDYPILYDVSSNMSGHTVLVPDHERPYSGLQLEGSFCVCVSDASAKAAREAGFLVIEVRDDVTFPRLYNYMQSVFVRLERLDTLLRAYVDTHAGAQSLLNACTQATGCSFALIDEQYQEICRSNWQPQDAAGPERLVKPGTGQAPEIFSALEDETIDLFMASKNYPHMRSGRSVFALPGSSDLLAKNLFVGSKLKGMVISRFSGDALTARYAHFILNYLSEFIEVMYAHMGSFGASSAGSDRIRVALSQLLSGGTANQASVQSLLIENGHAPESSYVILLIQRSFTYEGPEESKYLERRFEQSWPHAYCFTVGDDLFMLADVGKGAAPGERDFLADILIVARENLSKVGVSRPFSTMDQLDAACAQAAAALTQGSATDPTFWFYRFDDYALSWLVEQGLGQTPFEYVAHPAVTALARHDAAHGTDLLTTLATFIRCRYNATKTADTLFIARSTLLNRLERIAQLTGLDFDDADDLVYLSLSLALFS